MFAARNWSPKAERIKQPLRLKSQVIDVSIELNEA